MARKRNLRAVIAKQALKSRDRFVSLLADGRAQETQDVLFAECVTANADSAFGAEHRFASLRSLQDFRQAVPIRHYPELSPWVERSVEGESKVLTAQAPIRFWKTTGTTSLPKRIPVTPAAATRTMEAFLTLQGSQLHYYPELNERADTSLVTHISPKTIKEYLGPGKVPYCSTTELPVEVRPGREEFTPPWLGPLQAVEEDDAVRLYFLLCFAAAHDLYSVACLHPSRFQTVVSTLDARGTELIAELRAGTILGRAQRAPLPELADRLEGVRRATGQLRPCDLWPNLKFVTSWSGRYIRRYRPTMEANFSSEFLPTPSISSEAFTSMTIDRNPIAQPLNIRGGLFEFVPSEQEVGPNTPTLQFFELEVGQSYEVVLTSLGGLYRYATCDIFRVESFEGVVPRLEYIGRRSVSDLTGEKLAEEQVEDVLAQVLAEFDLEGRNFTVCGIQSETPHYVVVLEVEHGWDKAPVMARRLDDRFKTINSRYELKRNFLDLETLTVEPVSPGTFARHRADRVAQGAPAGQLKDKLLHPDGAPVLEQFRRLSEVRR